MTAMKCEGCDKEKSDVQATTVGQSVFNLCTDCRVLLRTYPTDGKRGLLYAKAVKEGNAFAARSMERLMAR